LSGNPAAALVTHEIFVRPVLWRMAGLRFAQGFNPMLQARVLGAAPEKGGRARFYLARVHFPHGEPVVGVDRDHSATGWAAPFHFNAVAEVGLRGRRLRTADRDSSDGNLPLDP